MCSYKTLSKSELVDLLYMIEYQLKPSIQSSHKNSKEYSTDIVSQLAYEVGSLNSVISNILNLIEEHKNL